MTISNPHQNCRYTTCAHWRRRGEAACGHKQSSIATAISSPRSVSQLPIISIRSHLPSRIVSNHRRLVLTQFDQPTTPEPILYISSSSMSHHPEHKPSPSRELQPISNDTHKNIRVRPRCTQQIQTNPTNPRLPTALTFHIR